MNIVDPKTSANDVHSESEPKSSNRKDKILKSAVRTFARYGFRGSTTKRLAKDARISEALVYRYFSSKAELFDAVLDYLVSRAPQIKESEKGSLQDRALLADLAGRIHSHFSRNPEELRLLLFAGLQGHTLAAEYFQRQVKGYYQLVIDRVRGGCEEGIYKEIPPALAARVFIGMVHYHVMIQSLFKDPVLPAPDVNWAESFVDIFLSGIRR